MSITIDESDKENDSEKSNINIDVGINWIVPREAA